MHSDFIRKNNINNFINDYKIFNKVLWLTYIKRDKPRLFNIIIDHQLKHFLHIKQVKKLYNEINILKR